MDWKKRYTTNKNRPLKIGDIVKLKPGINDSISWSKNAWVHFVDGVELEIMCYTINNDDYNIGVKPLNIEKMKANGFYIEHKHMVYGKRSWFYLIRGRYH